MDEIPFQKSRFINTHVDFYAWKKRKKRIQKSFRDSYNKLAIYNDTVGNGKLYFSTYDHDIQYALYDAYRNKSTLTFKVLADTHRYAHPSDTVTKTQITYTSAFDWNTDQIKIHIPAYSTYYNRAFNYRVTDTLPHAVTATHHIQSLYHPLQQYMTVQMYCPAPDSVGKKFYAVSLTSKNKVLSPEGGTFNNNWLRFKTRSFGPYTVMYDNVAPTIKPINFNANNVKQVTELRFQIMENESGIARYYALLDDEWHLVQLDQKTQQVWLDFDYHAPEPGAHTLKLVITDAVGNNSVWNMDFIW
jgi:hypothetical protein